MKQIFPLLVLAHPSAATRWAPGPVKCVVPSISRAKGQVDYNLRRLHSIGFAAPRSFTVFGSENARSRSFSRYRGWSCQGHRKGDEGRNPAPLLRATVEVQGVFESFGNVDSSLTPLYLSTVAGMSTCLGAAIVFLFPKNRDTGLREVGPGIMGFSLALAGSVMITVSAVSIVPECLDGVPLVSALFLQRAASFGLGWMMYSALSAAFPEPEHVLGNACTVLPFMTKDGSVLRRASSWTTGSDLETSEQQRAWRVASLLFFSLLFHNFPEGLGK